MAWYPPGWGSDRLEWDPSEPVRIFPFISIAKERSWDRKKNNRIPFLDIPNVPNAGTSWNLKLPLLTKPSGWPGAPGDHIHIEYFVFREGEDSVWRCEGLYSILVIFAHNFYTALCPISAIFRDFRDWQKNYTITHYIVIVISYLCCWATERMWIKTL